MKRAVIFILGIGLWSACGIEPVTHQSYEVTFRVLPDSLPDNGQVFITGNQDLLGNWSSGATALLPQPDGSWRRTFSFPSGTNLEYKFTRGSWRTEAVDAGEAAVETTDCAVAVAQQFLEEMESVDAQVAAFDEIH